MEAEATFTGLSSASKGLAWMSQPATQTPRDLVIKRHTSLLEAFQLFSQLISDDVWSLCQGLSHLYEEDAHLSQSCPEGLPSFTLWPGLLKVVAMYAVDWPDPDSSTCGFCQALQMPATIDARKTVRCTTSNGRPHAYSHTRSLLKIAASADSSLTGGLGFLNGFTVLDEAASNSYWLARMAARRTEIPLELLSARRGRPGHA
eukprot:CAMPEP_0115161128 /NCGR_PEP_ID=MMETSP0227-20121206/71179_1 /TAXON_ID=89957 /ORGANISM="Polarella glacialis, Strain CCMP 1383" /LENGTH=202 /DNA_ID=CAMNT_0002573083 /DNA_START=63 /DNA_END=668 /DNA_ORIENTATION=+